MQQQALNPARIAVVAIFSLTCFGLMLFLWNAFGGDVPFKPKAYEVTIALPEADLLSTQADVRISGVTIGHVVKTERTTSKTDPNRKDAVVELDPRYAPLHGDVKAIIRRKSLAGEMYLELTPGNRSAPAIPDRGRLPNANVAPSVDFDEVLRIFDPSTRRAFGEWIQAQGAGVDGRGAALNAAFGNLPGFESDLTQMLTILNRQQGAVRATFANTGQVFAALSQSSAALHGVIVNGRRATDAFAQQSASFADLWRVFPTFELESRRLLERAERFRKSAGPTITALRPGFREFSKTMQVLPPTAAELDGLLRAVEPLNQAEKRGLPAAQRFFGRLQPLLAEFAPFLAQLEPILAYARPEAYALTGFFANVTSLTNPVTPGNGADDTPIHYARGLAPLSPQILATYRQRLPGSRSNPYENPARLLPSDATPLPVFNDANCGDVWFPRIVGPRDGTTITADLVEKLRHFVLNDDQPVAPRCLLQQRPQGGAFPHVEALSQDPGGTTP